MRKINTDAIVQKFEENPVAFMAAAGGVLLGLSKIIEAVGNQQGSRAYAKQVNYRIKNNL
jgi:hypothetical protein